MILQKGAGGGRRGGREEEGEGGGREGEGGGSGGLPACVELDRRGGASKSKRLLN